MTEDKIELRVTKVQSEAHDVLSELDPDSPFPSDPPDFQLELTDLRGDLLGDAPSTFLCKFLFPSLSTAPPVLGSSPATSATLDPSVAVFSPSAATSGSSSGTPAPGGLSEASGSL